MNVLYTYDYYSLRKELIKVMSPELQKLVHYDRTTPYIQTLKSKEVFHGDVPKGKIPKKNEIPVAFARTRR